MAVSVERLITSDILKPARYLGNERLAVNKPWDSAAIRWVLTYPELYVESKRWLTDFDILGFSLSYELGATNILEVLDLVGIPKIWQERSSGNYPLVFVGGQTATPLSL